MSSNTDLYNRMNDIIDINAGTVISGEDSLKVWEKNSGIHHCCASGKVSSKAMDQGNNDFIPWKRGVSL
ncbi:MAG: hypothetical protein CM15mP32_3200 [Flavobacteriaceae bacterium]|nr:MAG: hypothetical protein CM15mP32_3200 [Flavobacteriaceae bacterium]